MHLSIQPILFITNQQFCRKKNSLYKLLCFLYKPYTFYNKLLLKFKIFEFVISSVYYKEIHYNQF
jgi:hypothetical protein